MIQLGSTTRVFLVSGATDMRKSFNGLSALVTGTLKADPLSDHLFVFCNKGRDRLKILFFDRSGYWVCAKRLEKGTFSWPRGGESSCEMSREELSLLLGGIDLDHTRKRPWFNHDSVNTM